MSFLSNAQFDAAYRANYYRPVLEKQWLIENESAMAAMIIPSHSIVKKKVPKEAKACGTPRETSVT